LRPLRLAVRTLPFHGSNTGSIPVEVAIFLSASAQIAQSVEQRTENPCVGGSIPSLGTISLFGKIQIHSEKLGKSRASPHSLTPS
jgi:hypothetical protein